MKKDKNFFHGHSRLAEVREKLWATQQDAADFFGVSRVTWGQCERGNSTPSGDVLAGLAQQGADVLYVLTGIPSGLATKPLPADEQMWLDCYREWDAPIKKRELRRAMGVLSEGGAESAQVAPAGPVGGAYSQHNSGANSVQIGGYGGKVTIKKGR